MKYRKFSFAILLLLIFTAAACANNNTQEDNADMNISSINTEEQSFDRGKRQKDNNNYRPIGANTGEGENRAEPRLFQRIPQGTIPGTIPNTPDTNEQQPRQTQPGQGPQYGLGEFESEVIALTNEERRRAGLSILEADNTLNTVARMKSQDMQANNYFPIQAQRMALHLT